MKAEDDILMLRYSLQVPSVRALIAGNFLAAAAILLFGGLKELAGLYVWDMVIVWGFSFARLAAISWLYTVSVGLLLLPPAAFFIAAFIFLMSLLVGPDFLSTEYILDPFVMASAVPLFFSHLYSFNSNFWPGRDRYRGVDEARSLRRFSQYPYLRVLSWALILLFACIAATVVGTAWTFYAFILLFKTASDVWGHVTLNDLKRAAAAP